MRDGLRDGLMSEGKENTLSHRAGFANRSNSGHFQGTKIMQVLKKSSIFCVGGPEVDWLRLG